MFPPKVMNWKKPERLRQSALSAKVVVYYETTKDLYII